MPAPSERTLLRIRSLRERAAQSLLIVPTVMIIGAAGVALAIDFFSHGIPLKFLPAPLDIGASAARTLLSTIAGATITTVGVVFSIVVVSVQLASGQFSPRIVRNFFDDPRSKITVGTLAATFTYSVLALFSLGRATSQTVPLVAVGLDVLFGLASILTIVSFLNHSARRLYVGYLAERVMNETLALLERDRFQGAAADTEEEAAETDASGIKGPEPPEDATVVLAPRNGWLQQLSVESLVGLLQPGAHLLIETRVGAYVIADTPIVRTWPPVKDVEHFARQARAAFVVGPERTMQQDIDFGLRQISDIALRALSPGIHDPHTAIEMILRHGAILERLLGAPIPPRRYTSGQVRVLHPSQLDYGDYIAHAFDDIRQVATDQPVVTRAMMLTCAALFRTARANSLPRAAAVARRQAQLMLAGAERSSCLPEDIAPLRVLVPDEN